MTNNPAITGISGYAQSKALDTTQVGLVVHINV